MPDLAALLPAALGRGLTPDERLAVAVSGGPDSAALLLLAAAAFPGRVTALTVDHGLRADSPAEAAMVGRQCAAAGIHHVTLTWSGARPSANIQAAARAARYRLMADWCAGEGIGLLLTAHHADDQAETLLMRLARGSGVAGLAGIRRIRDLGRGVQLVRPLLGVRRAALGQIAAASGWAIVDDPANRNPRFGRSHARALLAATDWIDVPQVAAVAAHLAEAEAALAWTAERAWAGRAQTADGGVILDAKGLPAEIRRRLVHRALAAVQPGPPPRGADIERMMARLGAGQTSTLAGVQARVVAGNWQFRCAKPRRR